MDRLVLWDIDRTLLAISGVGRDMYAAAFESVTGRTLVHVPDMAGKTDHELVDSVLALHDLDVTATIRQRFYVELAVAAHALRDDMGRHGHALPGAREALAALAQSPGVVQSVVTGNIRQVAHQKLSVYRLDRWIDFEVGGYGSDDGARSTLVRLARERAERTYATAFAADHTIVIGDTPHDIAGARENGVVSVGVATGTSSAAELTAAGAHVVLPSLVDTEAVVRAVLGRSR